MGLLGRAMMARVVGEGVIWGTTAFAIRDLGSGESTTCHIRTCSKKCQMYGIIYFFDGDRPGFTAYGRCIYVPYFDLLWIVRIVFLRLFICLKKTFFFYENVKFVEL